MHKSETEQVEARQERSLKTAGWNRFSGLLDRNSAVTQKSWASRLSGQSLQGRAGLLDLPVLGLRVVD